MASQTGVLRNRAIILIDPFFEAVPSQVFPSYADPSPAPSPSVWFKSLSFLNKDLDDETARALMILSPVTSSGVQQELTTSSPDVTSAAGHSRKRSLLAEGAGDNQRVTREASEGDQRVTREAPRGPQRVTREAPRGPQRVTREAPRGPQRVTREAPDLKNGSSIKEDVAGQNPVEQHPSDSVSVSKLYHH